MSRLLRDNKVKYSVGSLCTLSHGMKYMQHAQLQLTRQLQMHLQVRSVSIKLLCESCTDSLE